MTNQTNSHKWIKACAISMLLFVILGAFGAHGLEKKLSAHLLEIYKTGVFYHAIHGLALFVVAWLASISSNRNVQLAGCFFLLGIILFSGSLYLLAITGITKFGMITPLGGLSFIAGWGFVLLGSRNSL